MSTPDNLSHSSRMFYEQAKYKVAMSIFLFCLGLIALAFNSVYAGEANSAYYIGKIVNRLDDDHRKSAEDSLRGGYGFGSFAFILAAIIFWIAAIYYSPYCCGTPNEKKILSKPEEIDFTDTSSSSIAAKDLLPYQSNPISAKDPIV